MPTLEDAQQLVDEYVSSDALKTHMMEVSEIMRAFAKDYKGDEAIWAITGLLHDFDYEKYPHEHPMKGKEILKKKGYPNEVIEAIQGHANFSGVPRKTDMAKVLYAVDELSGLMHAIALMRPNGFADMKVKSVNKKIKDKSFAAKVNRDEISEGAQELGTELPDLIDKLIKIFRDINADSSL